MEIKGLGEARLAWGAEQKTSLERLRDHILAQDLDAPLADAEWRAIETTFEGATSSFWEKSFNTKVLKRTERGLNTRPHLEMAVREDLLDVYTRNNASQPSLPKELLDEIEERLRFIGDLPHRMGDRQNPVQGEPADMPLLFQIASDMPMGWMWGDAGALYVTISPEDLRRNRFRSVHAWIEGH